MIRVYFFTTLICFGFARVGSAQFEPKIDFGSTAVLQYSDEENGISPLAFNRGDKTFLATLDMFLGVRVNENLAMFAEIQSRQGYNLYLYALSIIYKPEKLPNLEFGKFQAPFGNFLKRRWANLNPLSNWPLIYDYRTALTRLGVPRNNSQLLNWRGRGVSVGYSVGAGAAEGLRILSRNVYLTGVQIFGGGKVLGYNLAISNGSLSTPNEINANDALNFIGRLTVKPTMGMELGASVASGTYIESEISVENGYQENKGAEDFRQKTMGVDFAYSLGHFELYAEGLANRWESPFVSENLDAFAYQIELKYSFLPRYFIAGRLSRINFSEIDDADDVDSDGNLKESWEYDVNQYEVGLGYDFNRNLLFKVFALFNVTDEVPEGDPDDNQISGQFVLSF